MDSGWFFWTFAKNLPLIIKTPGGGVVIWGGLCYSGKGLINYYVFVVLVILVFVCVSISVPIDFGCIYMFMSIRRSTCSNYLGTSTAQLASLDSRPRREHTEVRTPQSKRTLKTSPLSTPRCPGGIMDSRLKAVIRYSLGLL